MKLRRIFVVILIIALLVTSVYGISLFIVRSSGYHQYPTLDELRQLEGPEAKHEACKIPKIKLKLMSTEQLAQALLDYPYMFETHICSSCRQASDMVFERCDALRELVKRKDAKDILIEKFEVLWQDTSNWESVVQAEGLAIILTHNHTLARQLSIEEKTQLREVALSVYPR